MRGLDEIIRFGRGEERAQAIEDRTHALWKDHAKLSKVNGRFTGISGLLVAVLKMCIRDSSRGVVRFEGEDIAASGYAKHRREHVSLVFQDQMCIRDSRTPSPSAPCGHTHQISADSASTVVSWLPSLRGAVSDS